MIEIYTDGGSRGNPGLGAYAYVVLVNGESLKSYSACYELTTNNRMELKAVISSLIYVIDNLKPSDTVINIYSDSQLVINTISKGWKRNANLDLWKMFDIVKGELDKSRCDIKMIKVKGHSGNRWNEFVDKLLNDRMDNPVSINTDTGYKKF